VELSSKLYFTLITGNCELETTYSPVVYPYDKDAIVQTMAIVGCEKVDIGEVGWGQKFFKSEEGVHEDCIAVQPP
jgi:hypothetical protein